MGEEFSQLLLQQELAPRFGQGFLKDHAGKILSDPKIAIVELVANCWDAGADLVDISWPENNLGKIIIKDNGTGMTFEEFTSIWNVLSYNRVDNQGNDVVFPPGNEKSTRKAFGRNGKGRHGMFCFSNQYLVETMKNGEQCIFKVTRSENLTYPFFVSQVDRNKLDGHGFILSAQMDFCDLKTQDLIELIGSKFIADPSFKIRVNGQFVEFLDLEKVVETFNVSINGYGKVIIRHIDSQKTGRTSKQHGVAWWVNKRLVGESSWKGFDDFSYLDARKSEAKRHTFIVEADILQNSVEADWDGFQETKDFIDVSTTVKQFIQGKLKELFSDTNRNRKIEAIHAHVSEIKELPIDSRKMIGTFIEEIQQVSPSITQRDLNATVEILAKLEKGRSRYYLLEQLSKLNPDDLDGLSEILSKWTVGEAKLVLDVLDQRLKLIETLEKLVDNPTSDELHQIQPLFERGLWIFGPEYESIEFIANNSLNTVIQNLFKDTAKNLTNPRKRPDIVILPNSTLSIYTSDSYDQNSEVNGINKVMIIELKRGGFNVSRKERQQAQDYASELRKSGKIGNSASIVGFVLGSTIDTDAQQEITEGPATIIYTRTYNIILRQAHARMFNLQEKIKKLREENGWLIDDFDNEIESAIKEPNQITIDDFSKTPEEKSLPNK